MNLSWTISRAEPRLQLKMFQIRAVAYNVTAVDTHNYIIDLRALDKVTSILFGSF